MLIEKQKENLRFITAHGIQASDPKANNVGKVF